MIKKNKIKELLGSTSQTKLADYVGKTRACISSWIKLKYMPGMADRLMICKFLSDLNKIELEEKDIWY